MVVSLHMGWRHVLFASWPVDPDVLAPAVPGGLSLDTHDGSAWLSVIPFTNVDVRPRVLPAGSGVRIPEVNLRTYVTYDGEPGVYFLSLDADVFLAVLGARLTHHLPYFYADVDLSVDDGEVRFESRRRHPGARPARVAATYEPTGETFRADPDDLAYFLTERHRLYTRGSGGALRYTAVEHDRWPLREVEATIEANTLAAAAGLPDPEGEVRVLYSPGVDTVASRSRRLA